MSNSKAQALTLGIVTRAPKLPSDLAELVAIESMALMGYKKSRREQGRAEYIRGLINEALEAK
jgi:hypothetical protein